MLMSRVAGRICEYSRLFFGGRHTCVKHGGKLIRVFPANCRLAQSKHPFHLTFGTLEDTMQGLWDVLIGGRRFAACSFQIWDAELGYVGDGSLMRA